MPNHRPIHTRGQGIPFILALGLALILAGCASTPTLPQQGGTKAEGPAPALPKRDATVYHVLRGESELRLRIYRGGPLADLGHNHVATSSDIEGRIYLHESLAKSGFELTVPVNSFTLDEPQARKQEGTGFEGQLSPKDRNATKDHMLGTQVLDAEKYPTVKMRSLSVVGPPWYPRITVRITLHGESRDYVVPTAVVREPDKLIATGRLHIKQTDFGITPFSAVGGGLRVKDGLDIAFHFVAVPAN